MNINPIGDTLGGYVSVQQLAYQTGLSENTCAKILYQPTAHFRAETVAIVVRWVNATFGPCPTEDLFHPANIVTSGRLPLTGVPLEGRPTVIICSVCHMEMRHGSVCVNCDP